MTIDLSFKILPYCNITFSNIGQIRCNVCGKRTLVTFSKSLMCDKCKATLSEYASYVAHTVNSRLLYHNSKK